MNYTLKELTSMPFEDWAALIEIEDMVNSYNYNDDIVTGVVMKRKMMNYLGCIKLSDLRKHAVVKFSTV